MAELERDERIALCFTIIVLCIQCSNTKNSLVNMHSNC